jgi:hypothetical protein
MSVRDPELEPLVRNALTTQTIFRMRSFRREPHEQDESCIVHGKGVCFSSAELATE